MEESTEIFAQVKMEESIDFLAQVKMEESTDIFAQCIDKDIDYVPSSYVPKIKYKKRGFTAKEKRKLAGIIKQNEAIWNSNIKLHRNSYVVSQQWKKVASTMGKPIDACKANWKSLRDGMRYRANKKKYAISGSASTALEQEVTLHDNFETQFSRCMAFLNTLSSEKKRRTSSSSTQGNDIVVKNISLPEESSGIDMDPNQSSNYSHMTDVAKRKKDPLLDLARSMAENVEKIVNNHQTHMSRPKEQKMKHEVILLNLDRMLSKLPNDIVEDLNMKFISMAYDEIKKEAAISLHSNCILGS